MACRKTHYKMGRVQEPKGQMHVYLKKIRKTLAIVLGISLVFLAANTTAEVHAKIYSFTATISPTQVNISQIAEYLVIITNTGESTLGSASIAIPTGFTVLSTVTILNPPTLWNYELSPTSISISATGGGSALPHGGNVTLTFEAIAPSSSGMTTWTAEATTSIDGGGVPLTLQGEQPAVTVTTLEYIAPTISASPNTINNDQFSLISQLSGAKGGIPPYTYQWLEAFNGGTFSPIESANGLNFTFSPTTLTPTGIWGFKLNVTDSSSLPETVTSNTVNVLVNSALIAPEVTAIPNTVSQNQPSTLSSSQITTGTPPYTYRWFQKAPGDDYTTVGNDSSSYSFPGSTTTGSWEFILQVTDGTRASVNSSAVSVTVASTPLLTITVAQTAHGTINPGTISVSYGSDQSFTISADLGYYTSDVLVDGISVGAVGSLDLIDITTDHNLTATFTPIEYTLTVYEIGDGSVALSPDKATYHYGEVVQLTAIPAVSWRFSVWNSDLTGFFNPSTVTIDGNKVVTAIFVLNQYTIAAAAGVGGSISPSGTTIVDYGSSQLFTITPNAGYHILNVLVNGTSLGPVSSHIISDVTGDTTISASFALDTLTIMASAGSGGSIKPSGFVSVPFGDDQSFAVSSDADYHVTDVLVDGISIGAVTSYVFISVTSNHNITANFAADSSTYYIEVTSSRGSPTPSTQVNAGGSYSVSVTSPEGNTDHRWICTGYSIDGGATVPGTDYTFFNVQANQTIIFSWQEQYYLGVISPVGSTTGAGWYNVGTTTTVSIISSTVTTGSDTREVFTGWGGDATGTGAKSDLITVDNPKTITATWKTQYQVTYDTLGNTLQVIPPPIEWVDAETFAAETFPPLIINSAGNTREIFVADNRPKTINQPLTVTGTYQTQYLVTFKQNGMENDASGIVLTFLNGTKTYEQLPYSTWVNASDQITFNYMATVEATETGKQYTLTSSNTTSPLIINEPATIQGSYQLRPRSSGFTVNTLAIAAATIAIPASLTIPLVVKRRRKRKLKIKPIPNEGGVISPSTVQTIDLGGDSTVFIITANKGFKIADVVIDNAVHIGPVRTYKFTNVTKNHIISAIYQKN
jgi:hypothetical protein